MTTAHSSLVAHVANLGAGAAAGAISMSLLALAGTIAKGFTGALSERIDPKRLLVTGLALQSIAIGLLCMANGALSAYAASILFGIGWGLSWLSAHVLLLDTSARASWAT